MILIPKSRSLADSEKIHDRLMYSKLAFNLIAGAHYDFVGFFFIYNLPDRLYRRLLKMPEVNPQPLGELETL
jgi:hypothetical protein